MCVSESEWVRVDALKTVKENASDGVERVRSGSGARHNGHRAGVLGSVRASDGRRADSDR